MSGGDADAGVASGKAEPARLVRALPHLVMLAAAVFLYWAANQIDAEPESRSAGEWVSPANGRRV